MSRCSRSIAGGASSCKPAWRLREQRIGECRERDTLMFNGYTDQVTSLYTGVDLKKYS